MTTIERVGIVPPWLGADVPHIMGKDDPYLPVLPVVPEPPDWDVVDEGELLARGA